MDLDDIRQILNLVREHELSEFELERDGLKVRIRKAGNDVTFVAPAAPVAPVALPAPASAAAASSGPTAATTTAGASAELEPLVDLAMIKSPIVGTFYRSPEPGAPNFVEVGDQVSKGQVLCIIEAMKLMNEIECDTDGELTAVHVENGRPVQFGDRLFSVKVAGR
jgi:acetyl-CoA carboxylase biotin carboxyl carrier protein